MPFFWIFPELNREMLSANARIDTPHHWQSSFRQWVVNGRGVSYWTKHGPGTLFSQVRHDGAAPSAAPSPCRCLYAHVPVPIVSAWWCFRHSNHIRLLLLLL